VSGAPRLATPAELETWDEHTVWTPSGHVYQSRTWGEQRARLGWTPLHVVLDADHRALVLLRRAPFVGSASAYIPRGPATTDEDAPAAAARLVELARWLTDEHGVDVLASDAEVPAAIEAYGRAMRSAGFRPIPEIQPSRHHISLAIPADADDEAIRAGLTKSTRQRIDRAARDGIVVTRYDGAGWTESADLGGAGSDPPLLAIGTEVPLFAAPPEGGLDAALEGFADLLTDTGARRGFRFGPRQVFIDWWRAGLAAGMVVYLAAHDPAEPERTLGGLLLYRHGDRLSTVHSGDVADIRERHPGIMHLLRWRAIQLALREGRSEMDLGGVDVGPDHAEPGEGDPMAGLYEHKRSFGARWVAMTGANERVARPVRATVARVATRVGRLVGGRG
jgi:lipid II:glycine glycyltransferase (peptidoglycan interpeptide bridge formation enzyme)